MVNLEYEGLKFYQFVCCKASSDMPKKKRVLNNPCVLQKKKRRFNHPTIPIPPSICGAISPPQDPGAKILIFIGRWVKQKGVDHIAMLTQETNRRGVSRGGGVGEGVSGRENGTLHRKMFLF